MWPEKEDIISFYLFLAIWDFEGGANVVTAFQ